MTWRIHHGDALDVLRTLPEASARCCVTSPPYFNLRDYGTASWVGGDPACEHKGRPKPRQDTSGATGPDHGRFAATRGTQPAKAVHVIPVRGTCRCGAERVDQQIGLEETPDEYISRLVDLYREVRRVLTDDGTLWLNLGDSYSAGCMTGRQGSNSSTGVNRGQGEGTALPPRKPPAGFKPKDLLGIPWRVALALQADGWYLRSDIIWAKPNPMPESVRDRPTKSHEYLFLFSKGQWVSRVVELSDLRSERVHLGKDLRPHDSYMGPLGLCVRLASAIFDRSQREEEFGLPSLDAQEWKKRADGADSDFCRRLPPQHGATVWAARFLSADVSAEEFLCQLHGMGLTLGERNQLHIGGGAAKLSLPPGIYGDGKGAIAVHHAGKVCKFDIEHRRILTEHPAECRYFYNSKAIEEPATNRAPGNVRPTTFAVVDPEKGRTRANLHEIEARETRNKRSVWTITTQPFPAAHFAVMPEALVEPCILAGSEPGDTVIDPTCGAATVGVVALRHQRNFTGCDLNGDYVAMGSRRIVADAPLWNTPAEAQP